MTSCTVSRNRRSPRGGPDPPDFQHRPIGFVNDPGVNCSDSSRFYPTLPQQWKAAIPSSLILTLPGTINGAEVQRLYCLQRIPGSPPQAGQQLTQTGAGSHHCPKLYHPTLPDYVGGAGSERKAAGLADGGQSKHQVWWYSGY